MKVLFFFLHFHPKIQAIYVKLMTKVPGISGELVQTELDLSYHTRFSKGTLPDA